MRQVAMFGLVALIGCAPDPDMDDAPPMEEEPAEQFEQPEFLEPAGGEFTIALDRTEDLELAVRGIRPNLTRVLIDGQSIGVALDDTSLASLSPDQVTLKLEGGMVVGEHTLQMRTVSPDDVLDSQIVTLFVETSSFAGLTASMNDTAVFDADTLMAQGHGDEGVLLGLNLDTEPVALTLVPNEGDGWAFADRVTLELPDFDRTDEPYFTVSAALRQLDDTTRVRIAWRSGEEGRRMLGSDVLWPPASIQVQTVLDLAESFGGFEYSRLGRPLLLGDTLVFEALFTQDIERPAPGDRTLLTSNIDVDDSRVGEARRSAVAGGKDLDRIAPVVDLLTHLRGGTPGFSARTASVRAVTYDVDATTGTLSERPSGANDRFSLLRDINGPPQTILGSLQARHVFAPVEAEGPRVFLRQFDDRPRGGSEDVAPSTNALEDLTEVTSPPVATIIGGLPVFLVPQGTQAPVAAIVNGSTAPRVLRLDGLACDEIAVPIAPDAADTGTVSVACRRGRAVHRGTLTVDEES